MFVNPKLFTHEGKHLPLAEVDEAFVLRRESIQLQVTTPSGDKFSSNGTIFLTTLRLVFVADKASKQNGITFSAFDIPLRKIDGEKFNQPIMGANNMSGLLYEDPSKEAKVYTWKLMFKNGGTNTFLMIFLKAMKQIRAQEIVPPSIIKESQAFVDPKDPTKIYVTQPVRESI